MYDSVISLAFPVIMHKDVDLKKDQVDAVVAVVISPLLCPAHPSSERKWKQINCNSIT